MLLAFLAVGLAWPELARADCRHPADRPAVGLDVPTLHAESLLGHLPPTDAPPAPPQRCDGPQCSGKSAPVPSTATIPPPGPPGEQALSPGADSSPPPGSGWLWFAPALVGPIATPALIWHPPRSAR